MAHAHKMKSVGFSCLSAGIFRGDEPLDKVLFTGLLALSMSEYPVLEEAMLIGFTSEERSFLVDLLSKYFQSEATLRSGFHHFFGQGDDTLTLKHEVSAYFGVPLLT